MGYPSDETFVEAHSWRRDRPRFSERDRLDELMLKQEKEVERRPARPLVVCLCGSTRFYEQFQVANYKETMAGRIVLTVGFYRKDLVALGELPIHEYHGEALGCTPEQKVMLDELHKRKIDLADEILVLNVGGYIGESTRSEIDYATTHGKAVRYLEPIR